MFICIWVWAYQSCTPAPPAHHSRPPPVVTSNAYQDLYRFCSKDAQGSLDSVREVLADMIRGKAPAMTMLNSTPFYRQVAEALPLFCRKGKKHGSEAIKEKYQDSCTHMHVLSLYVFGNAWSCL